MGDEDTVVFHQELTAKPSTDPPTAPTQPPPELPSELPSEPIQPTHPSEALTITQEKHTHDNATAQLTPTGQAHDTQTQQTITQEHTSTPATQPMTQQVPTQDPGQSTQEQTTQSTPMQESSEALPHSLQNILDQRSLKWIFVGGKGGVGKTTTSCALACALSKQRENVLLVSTDPAHNLSDAFCQKFTKEPTAVSGFNNLFAMEIDPKFELETGDVLDGGTTNLLAELASSVPGIDEAMSFSELMKQVQNLRYDVIVFDTAPTGHTLRLLSFPSILENAFTKFDALKHRFANLFKQVSNMMQQANTEEKTVSQLEQTKETVLSVNRQFKDAELTTFVCVCIPEFLSLFETERLVQELAKFEIDVHNIVVNQVLVPEPGSTCRKCTARVKMQSKYLNQIHDLYGEDFHVTELPLLDEEVRGPSALLDFSKLLLAPSK